MTAELRQAARNLRAARSRLAAAMEAAQAAAITAHGNGTPETEIATTLGVNRMTVRRWLGKL
jgi:transposase